jgi:hypothetical protein
MVRLEPRTKPIVVECGCPGPDAVLVDMIAAAKGEAIAPWADRYARTHNADGLPNAGHARPRKADPELLARIREASERARRLVDPLPDIQPVESVVDNGPAPEPVVPIDRGRPRRVGRDLPRVIYPSFGDDGDD